jgi:hypothetical protein
LTMSPRLAHAIEGEESRLSDQLKKCPQCAEMVQAEANVCRYCGHQFVPVPKRKKVGCWWIGIGVIGLLFVIGKIAGPLPDTKSSLASSGSSTTTGDPPTPAWEYSDSKDQLGVSTRTAQLSSDNSVDFDFPYNGEQHGTLMVRKGKDGTNVMFLIEKGQILCHSFMNETITVRFDDGPIQKFRCVGPADSSTETAFFSDGKRFLHALLKSKKVVLEPNIYQQGGTQFTFESAGLKWDN